MTRVSLWTLMTVWLGVVSLVVTQGQACPDIVNEALSAVDTNCSSMDRNDVCYGYDEVQAAFLNDVSDDVFTTPSDVADVLRIETLTTSELDTSADTWGVAVMKLQANVPRALPGQAVTFVLLGETEVENAVEPEAVFTPADAIEVTTTADANIRSGPGLNYNVTIGAGAGDTLSADGVSPDAGWVRVVHRERVGWISRQLLAEGDALADLPTLEPGLRTPMQAFYLRTGLGRPDCDTAPDTLMVQGPQNADVDLTVNGTNIRIGSTILIRQLDENTLEFIVLDGTLTFLNDNHESTGTVIRENYRATVCLDPPENRGLNGEADDQEVSCGADVDYVGPQPLGIDWCELEAVPESVLNYAVDLFCEGDPPPPQFANEDTATDSEVSDVSCEGFRLESPLGGEVQPNAQTFSWTDAPGADYYTVQFYDYQGNPQDVFIVRDSTSFTVNLGQNTSTGGSFAWEVRAYSDETGYACVTYRSPAIVRNDAGFIPEPEPDDTPPPFNIRLVCEAESVVLTWSGLPAGQTLFVNAESFSFDDTAASGSYTVGQLFTYGIAWTIQPSGRSGSLNTFNCLPQLG